MLNSTLTRILLICSLCTTLFTARAQYVAIPDSNFVLWIRTTSDSQCLVGNQLDTICAQTNPIADTIPPNGALYLDLSNLNIASFEGMEYIRFSVVYQDFNSGGIYVTTPSFNSVNLSHNMLTSFPDQIMTIITAPNSGNYTNQSINLSYNHIDSLIYIHSRDIYTMNLSNNGMHYFSLAASTNYVLTNIYLDYNNLNSLPSFYYSNPFYVTQNCFYTISARHNQLQSIPSGKFSSIDVGANQINSINYNAACYYPMSQLICDSNGVNTIQISGSGGVNYLNVAYNNIANLNLPANVTKLVCSSNNIQSLPALPSSLTYLDCHSNLLTYLPLLPPSLTYLDCSYNQLTTVPILPSSLTSLIVKSNFGLSCLPRINNNLSVFDIQNTSIACVPNRFSAISYDINPNTLSLCTPASGCDFYYNIAGNAHQDTSFLSCLLDSLYPNVLLQNIKIQLRQNGQVQQQFYTNNSGEYTFKTDSFGTYEIGIDTLSVNVPLVCPGSGINTVTLSNADSVIVNQNFGFICPQLDYGVIYITSPYVHPFRYSIVTSIAIDIANVKQNMNCNTLSGSATVTTIFSGSIQYAGPATNALTPSTISGDTLIYNMVNLDSIQPSSFGLFFYTDTNAVIGSPVCITSIVKSSPPDANPADDTLTQCFVIHDPHDPNLKEVYPIDTLQSGQWLTYTVHFQNTGNDTAHTVIINDTLSNYIDASTFQYIASSNKAFIQLFGNAVVFTFPKINLPDSAASTTLSQGWIQYKVKTLPSLPANAKVTNTAYIYFDVNPAVVTNTTINIGNAKDTTLGITSLSGSSPIHLYPNPNRGSFTLATSGSIGSDYTISDMLGHIITHSAIRSDSQSIDLPEASEGVYTLVVKGLQPIRFVIVR